MRHGHNSLALHVVQAVPSATPPSFNGDTTLYAANLFGMTAIFFLAAMLGAWTCQQLWSERHTYPFKTTLHSRRLVILCVCLAATLRCGGEALLLWGWSPTDPIQTARVLAAKRWIDPVALLFAAAWMTLHVVSEPGIDAHLRQPPPPKELWSSRRVLFKAGGVLMLSLIMALAAVFFR